MLANYSRSHHLLSMRRPSNRPTRAHRAPAAADAWSLSRPSSAVIRRAARQVEPVHPGTLRRDPARHDTVTPRQGHASGSDDVCISSVQKQQSHHQNQTDQFPATAMPSHNRTSCYQIRPLIDIVSSRRDQRKVEKPIAHRVRPAGSGTVDFPTPRGVRNSKRKRSVCFRAGVPGEQTFDERCACNIA